MRVTPIKTTVFEPDQDIIKFIKDHISTLEEKSVLVITSKIVALAEGRTRTCNSKEEKIALIKSESEQAIETPWTWLTVKDGQVYASAGIDESNVEMGTCVLLPENSYASAASIRADLCAHYGITDLGIIITDSRLAPLRQGAMGIALGYAGIVAIRDYRGTPDIYGRQIKCSTTNVPDSLASAAVFVMGEGTETCPLALITGASVTFNNEIAKKEDIQIPLEDDIYLPFFKDIEL